MNGVAVVTGIMVTNGTGRITVENVTAVVVVRRMHRVFTVIIAERGNGRVTAHTGTITHVTQSTCTITRLYTSVPVAVGKSGDGSPPYIVYARSLTGHITKRSALTDGSVVLKHKTGTVSITECVTTYFIYLRVRTAQGLDGNIRRTLLYQTIISKDETRATAHRATHSTGRRAVSYHAVYLIRMYKCTSALQIGAYYSRTVLNKTVVGIDQTVTTALCTAQLAFHMAVTNGRTRSSIEDQQRLIDTCHLGICHADILNSTAINIHEQCFVHHRPIVAIQLKFKIIRIPIVRPVHSTAVVQVIDCMAVAIKIPTKIAIISRIIILH